MVATKSTMEPTADTTTNPTEYDGMYGVLNGDVNGSPKTTSDPTLNSIDYIE